MPTIFEDLVELIDGGIPCVSVTVVDTSGSVPNERGSRMIVTNEGLHRGTVGGGKVEKRAIEEAALLLTTSRRHKTHFVNWSLNKDIGMTCGGSVRLYFEAFNTGSWRIVVFGAGHVANALIRTLVNLDCKLTCVDPREEWLAKLPDAANLTKLLRDDMPAEVHTLAEDAFVVLMTMGHTTDKPILLEILRSRRFPYLGVIGSEAKAVRLRKDVAEAGLPAEMQRAFFCPIGLSIGTNDPQEIALSVAAQMLQERDRIHSERIPSPSQ
ncbi:MAG TPA: xanthine dehydrogenase accessory protein XdhC [Thermoanaerobaculia bacterium]|nr:xanthine dehydrogenase accessory protein XdhC [Thermoanaerobaculia bacterium]